jgi:hypothetical protein
MPTPFSLRFDSLFAVSRRFRQHGLSDPSRSEVEVGRTAAQSRENTLAKHWRKDV